MFNRQRLFIITLSMVLLGTFTSNLMAAEEPIEPELIGKGEYAEESIPIGEGSLAEKTVEDPVCGNGRIESGEQCDPDTRSEAAADYCDEDCQLIIPHGWMSCYRQEYSDCVRDKGEFGENANHYQQPASKSRAPSGEIRDTPPAPVIDRECQEEAILVCEPAAEEEVDLPEVNDEPTLPEVEETVQELPGPSFEVSGSGCTIQGAGPAAPSGLIVGWIAASLSLVIRRRR